MILTMGCCAWSYQSLNPLTSVPELDNVALEVGRREKRLEDRAIDLGHDAVGRLAAQMIKYRKIGVKMGD